MRNDRDLWRFIISTLAALIVIISLLRALPDPVLPGGQG